MLCVSHGSRMLPRHSRTERCGSFCYNPDFSQHGVAGRKPQLLAAARHNLPTMRAAHHTHIHPHRCLFTFQRPCRSTVATLCSKADRLTTSIRASSRACRAPQLAHHFVGGGRQMMHIWVPDVPTWRVPAAAAEPATSTLLPAVVALVLAGVTNRILCTRAK